MTSNLRILAVTNTYPTTEKSGDSPQIRDQIEALQLRGVHVELMYINRYKGKRSYFQAAWRIALLSFQSKRYDLIHAFYGHCGFLARLQVKYPIVVTFLGSDLLHSRDGAIGKVAAKLADGIIVQSEEMKRVSKRDDAYVIPFGVNLRIFKPSSVEEVRRELGFSVEEKLVLFPWNPSRYVKRFDIIQAAVRILQAKHDKVVLVTVYDQPHEIVAKYMNACNVLVLASEHEGSPMALREAMACNLPIVAVDVGDVRQMIGNTEGCYLCKREPVDIAEKIELVIGSGNRTSGYQDIRLQDASWGADQVLLLYQSVLASRKIQKN